MSALGLVAYDGSGSEDEDEMMSEENPQNSASTNSDITASDEISIKVAAESSTLGRPLKPSVIFSRYLDDDDDEDIGMHDGGDEDEGRNELEAASSESTWSKLLPQPKKVTVEIDAADEDVEIGPIPPKKTYGDEELPPPKSSSVGSLTATKIQGKVRISIPFLNSLDEHESAEESGKKKYIEPSKKGSGLFALLPQPKNSMSLGEDTNIFLKSNKAAASKPADSSSSSSSPVSKPSINRLIPDSVKNKLKRPAPEKLAEVRAKYMKKSVGSSASATSHKDSDGSDDEDGGSFFALDAKEIADPEALEKLKLPTPDFEARVHPVATEDSEESMEMEDHYQQPASSSSQAPDLMQYIQPRRGRKEDVQIIDINADDLRPDNTEWLKNMTDEAAVPPRRSKGMGGMTKRKHQITYLAFEAKAREQELKNQWAQNRANKMATNNKYGF